jgi:hypothetical protein
MIMKYWKYFLSFVAAITQHIELPTHHLLDKTS